jgi:Kae1-associated kinase Bud32
VDKVLYRGAEAILIRSQYKGYSAVLKRRISKKYRIQEIDQQLITARTKEEAKLIAEARRCGVAVPILYDVDLQGGVITMQYLDGVRVKDMIEKITEKKRKELCLKIGTAIARLHNHDVIHGDITTSNMIVVDEQIHFIDFGLGCKGPEVEIKGVDLHVLMEAFESTHSQFPKCFSYVLKGYTAAYNGDAQVVINKIEDIVQRGRYR